MKTSTFELMDVLGRYHTLTQKVYELDMDKDRPIMEALGIERGVARVVFDADGDEVHAHERVMELACDDDIARDEAIQSLFWTQEHVESKNHATALYIENMKLSTKLARRTLEAKRLASRDVG